MTQLSRWLVRYELVRTAAVWLGVAVLAVVVAYLFAAIYVTPTPGGIAGAVALLAVAGSGLLYAFRPGTGGPGD
jgi:hypothetical protein